MLTILPVVTAVLASNNFSGIGDLFGGDFYSNITAISGDGTTVVGYSSSKNNLEYADSNNNKSWKRYEAFKYVNHILLPLGDLPGDSIFDSRAYGVSEDGSYIVGASVSPNSITTYNIGFEACVWSPEGLQGLGVLDNIFLKSSWAYSVSNNGVVVGGVTKYTNYYGARWIDGVMTHVSGFSNLNHGSARSITYSGDIIVGNDIIPEVFGNVFCTGGYLYTDKQLYNLFHECSFISAISGNGQFITGQLNYNPIIMTVNIIQYLKLPDNCSKGGALTCSADGRIVIGYGINELGRKIPLIWDDYTKYPIDLTIISDIWDILEVTDISDDGTIIVGNGLNFNGLNEGWILSDLDLSQFR